MIRDLDFFYGKYQVLDNVSLDVSDNSITAVTGPSGKGKSSFLTVINRLWPSIPGARAHGSVRIRFEDQVTDIMGRAMPLTRLRQKVGMVFQTPNPLPMSIMKNMVFPLKLSGRMDRDSVHGKVEDALRRSHLWDEVKDRLNSDARTLSGGQQQRLCMARALILNPDILLLDEPTSSLDTRSARGIEELIIDLKNTCTLVMVSHYLDQVKRIADQVLVLRGGRFVMGMDVTAVMAE